MTNLSGKIKIAILGKHQVGKSGKQNLKHDGLIDFFTPLKRLT